MTRILTAYFSVSGQNYWNGRVVDLPVGNTRKVAEKISAMTGSELYEIRPVQTYAKDYTKRTEEAKQELKSGVRPALAGNLPDMDDFDVIFIGYPIWWGMMPMPVMTFLEGIDTAKKTVCPFCTHEGSGLGNSMRWVKKACPKADVRPGLPITGHLTDDSDEVIERWIGEITK